MDYFTSNWFKKTIIIPYNTTDCSFSIMGGGIQQNNLDWEDSENKEISFSFSNIFIRLFIFIQATLRSIIHIMQDFIMMKPSIAHQNQTFNKSNVVHLRKPCLNIVCRALSVNLFKVCHSHSLEDHQHSKNTCLKFSNLKPQIRTTQVASTAQCLFISLWNNLHPNILMVADK